MIEQSLMADRDYKDPRIGLEKKRKKEYTTNKQQ
jgi:hypothetical protein